MDGNMRLQKFEKTRAWYFLILYGVATSFCQWFEFFSFLLLWRLWLCFLRCSKFCSSKPWTHICDFYLCTLSHFCIFHKNNKSLNFSYAVTLSACFCNLHIVFFTCFYRFWTEVSATKAVAC